MGLVKVQYKEMMSPNFMNKHILWFIMTIGFTVLASDELCCLVKGIRIVFEKKIIHLWGVIKTEVTIFVQGFDLSKPTVGLLQTTIL